jgi:GntR family transcriptional regulator, arabinose operon transcriptional repressor
MRAGNRLDKIGVQAALFKQFQGSFTAPVIADGADQSNVIAQSPQGDGNVEWSTAEIILFVDDIPQQFTDAQDAHGSSRSSAPDSREANLSKKVYAKIGLIVYISSANMSVSALRVSPLESQAFAPMNRAIERLKRTKNALNGDGKAVGPKYRTIFESLKESILSGEYGQGARLPSETDLVRRFGVSRMTIVKAIKELQNLGLVVRRVGSGTYANSPAEQESRLFGLLIPELGQTEIFEPICKGMANAPFAASHSLLWGSAPGENQSKEQVTEQLCQQYIGRRVAGVFFAPLELTPGKDEVNRRIITALARAKIPVVLLDRCFLPYPMRSKYDLIGIDNRRTAYIATEHLVRAGAKRIAFLGKPFSASTVDARIAGYREALSSHGFPRSEDLVTRGDPGDEDLIRRVLNRQKPDAFLCANDHTAATLMRTLIRLDRRIPEDVRIVGIDDVKYASLLPIPLTTQHQPCLDIGRVAMSAMLERLTYPEMPTRDILLNCHLVVRQSCGGPSLPS